MRLKTTRALWGSFVVLSIVGVCGTNLLLVARRVRPPSVAPDAPRHVVVRQEARFAPVRAALEQAQAPRLLRYVADLRPPQLQADHASMEEYFSAQFALVPWVLDAHANDDNAAGWVVANLRRTTRGARLPPEFRVVREFGDGLWLLERTRAP